MRTRAITGVLFVLVMIASVLAGAPTFGFFYLMLSLLCLKEFNKLSKQAGNKPNEVLGYVNCVVIYAAFALLNYKASLPNPGDFTFQVNKFFFILPVTLGGIFVAELFKTNDKPFANIGFTFLGIIFATLPWSFFHALAYAGNGFNNHIPMAFLIMLWSNDTGAYLSGRWLGRTKLFERHSPKKTWEGFFGGVLIAAIAGYVLSIFFTELTWNVWVSMAVIIGCVGTLGDLVESMFKRSLNIKDSGGILPGHGGLLDRFDGLLLAAPVVYSYLYFISNS
ncbi:phosphatidate cytidylyltransferase [Mucilaginibacter ginkgonis]|uniref:Phosphatidate cytidylyltransferase n=1 Tax=Mucilaginibacter ginkgonis TaxID=2682091 RepID=A0A6I4HYI0_9SPHI|nr:phosphatidate cytidylyltransferase [Mucilaginibacter ginkgonis]QQL49524.1 phosphatidate cytidylyltransferase [Mucilaginibacter ginkgonis]